MKKNIRVLTYCTSGSIGSILQAYALSKTLQFCGHECTVWPWSPPRSNRNKNRGLKGLIKKIYSAPIQRKIHDAQKKRQLFIETNIKVERLHDYQSFQQRALDNPEDVYLAGSDQIWNPDHSSPVFFLDFVSNSKRISYAASMGKTVITPEQEEPIRNMLGSFDRISVREQACADTLRSLTEKPISVHVDPTFLLSAEEWRALEQPYAIRGPYILLYMLYWDKSCKKQIQALKKRTQLPVYAICPSVSRVYADKRLYDVGVGEFLWLIDHAEYVVTSSFHGVAFSVIFRKKFSAVINPRLPSRIGNVLNVLSVPLVNVEDLDGSSALPYDSISANIEREYQRSIEYLKEATK